MCDLNWVACWFSVTNNWATCWSENNREHENIHVKSTRHRDVNVMKQQAASFWVWRLRPHSDFPRFCHCLPLVSVEHPAHQILRIPALFQLEAGFRSQTIATRWHVDPFFSVNRPRVQSFHSNLTLKVEKVGWRMVKTCKKPSAFFHDCRWKCCSMTLPARDKPKSKQWLKMAVEYGERRDLPGDCCWWWGGLWIGFRIERLPIDIEYFWILLEPSKSLWMNGIPVTAAAGGMATQLHHSPARGAENNPSYDIIWGLLVRSAVYDEPQTHHPLVTTHVLMSCPR